MIQQYGTSVITRAAVDEGLRSHMLRVYNYMAGGLALSGVVAWLAYAASAVVDPVTNQIVEYTAFGKALYASPLRWVVALAPLGFLLVMHFRFVRMSMAGLQTMFWVFATAMGLSLSYIFLVYSGGSIAKVFLITSCMFAAMSLYGYTTRKDLSTMGAILFMGFVGIFIAAAVNLFVGSSALSFAISFLAVIIFTGLTAHDTQKIKEMYLHLNNEGGAASAFIGKAAIMGAVALYIDFINIFVHLLRLIGERR